MSLVTTIISCISKRSSDANQRAKRQKMCNKREGHQWKYDCKITIAILVTCHVLKLRCKDHDAWSNNLLRIRNMILFLFGSTLLRCPVKIKIYCWSITWLMHFWDDFGFNKNLSQGEQWFLETLTIEKFEKRKQVSLGEKEASCGRPLWNQYEDIEGDLCV